MPEERKDKDIGMMKLTQFVSTFDNKPMYFIDYDYFGTDREKRKLYKQLQEKDLVDYFRRKRPHAIKDMELAVARLK